MSYINFIKNHVGEINKYVQSPTLWREGKFTGSARKIESTNGDFAEVVRDLPDRLSREDVVGFFRKDLYRGFVATIMWGGINRHLALGIAQQNDRNATMPKLERLVTLLRDSETDIERIDNAIASLKRGGENHFYGIGPSYFTKLLYFLAYDMNLNTRPLIYDENMKPVHFALMPEAGQNPFFYYYVPVGKRVICTKLTKFDDVYYDYCELLCKTAREIGVDVKNLEAWVFGWPVNINSQQPNPRVIAKTEVARMAAAEILRCHFGIEELDDAIGASRIFYDNKIDVPDCFYTEDGVFHIGNDEEHPIVITEPDGYIHLEYVITDILFQLKKLNSKMISQYCISVGEKKLDRLCFEVTSVQDKKPREIDVYFDITTGYNDLS